MSSKDTARKVRPSGLNSTAQSCRTLSILSTTIYTTSFQSLGTVHPRSNATGLPAKDSEKYIRPVNIQGWTSHSVIAGPSGNKIIQIREQAALLDMKILSLAKDVHKDVVAPVLSSGGSATQMVHS